MFSESEPPPEEVTTWEVPRDQPKPESSNESPQPADSEVVKTKTAAINPERPEARTGNYTTRLKADYPGWVSAGLHLDSYALRLGSETVEEFAKNLYLALLGNPKISEYVGHPGLAVILLVTEVHEGHHNSFNDAFNGLSFGLNSTGEEFAAFFQQILPAIEKKNKFGKLANRLMSRLRHAVHSATVDYQLTIDEFLKDPESNRRQLQSIVKLCEQYPEQFRFTDRVQLGANTDRVGWTLGPYENLISLDIPFPGDAKKVNAQLASVLEFAKLSRQVFMSAKAVGHPDASIDVRGLLLPNDPKNPAIAKALFALFRKFREDPAYHRMDNITVKRRLGGIVLEYRAGSRDYQVPVPLELSPLSQSETRDRFAA